MRIFTLAAALALLAPLAPLYAGHEMIENTGKKQIMPEDEFPFTRGSKELSLGGAAFGSFDTTGSKTRPDYGYALGELRFGVMLWDPKGSGFLRGNVELMLEGTYGQIFEGPGSILAGGELIIRYNFVQPHARLVPYFQILGGGIWSNASYHDYTERLIGANWSFSLGGELGGRYMLSRNTSISAGFEYRHFSNKDLAERNRGLNALGGNLTFSYYF